MKIQKARYISLIGAGVTTIGTTLTYILFGESLNLFMLVFAIGLMIILIFIVYLSIIPAREKNVKNNPTVKWYWKEDYQAFQLVAILIAGIGVLMTVLDFFCYIGGVLMCTGLIVGVYSYSFGLEIE